MKTPVPHAGWLDNALGWRPELAFSPSKSMPRDLSTTYIYHITPLSNLPAIIRDGGLLSDARVVGRPHEVIGYAHIKERRISQYRVPCCQGAFVGQFVPFYYCPRSPMLLTINSGRTGKPPGCQRDIVHLVSTVAAALGLGRPWAISDGNAGAAHTSFDNDTAALDSLDWGAINARQWQGRTHEKAAEFLVYEFFPWTAVTSIGCMTPAARDQASQLLQQTEHRPTLAVRPDWYY